MNDETFLARFEACDFGPDEWTHRDHIKLAYLELITHDFDTALERVRHGIKRLNASHETPETLTRGYHETITHAWLKLVHFTIEQYGRETSADAFCDAHPELSQSKILRFFYSRERIISEDAKATIIEPDLAPFPAATTTIT